MATIIVVRFSCVGSVPAHFLISGDRIMPDYEKLYFELFNKITDTIELLKEVQKDAEDKYISSEQK